MVQIKQAQPEDIATIIGFIDAMEQEIKEFPFNREKAAHLIAKAIERGFPWFLFIDDEGKAFGTCYLDRLYNCLDDGKWFYIGGVYVMPEYRGGGLFTEINTLLQDWAFDHGATKIYAHVHKENEASQRAFEASNFVPDEYMLYVNYLES